MPIATNEKLPADSEILFNKKKVGRVLIDKPYPFALIKLFDPDFAEFSNKELFSNNLKIKLLKPSFF